MQTAIVSMYAVTLSNMITATFKTKSRCVDCNILDPRGEEASFVYIVVDDCAANK
jgi:hypothetical protein